MRVVIYGSRPDGHAKVLVDLFGDSPQFAVAGVVDDYAGNQDRRVRSLEVVGTSEGLGRLRDEGVEGVLLGFGEAPGRLDAMKRVRAAGLSLPPLIHPAAHVSATARIGDGAQVLVGAYVGPDARLAAGVLLNTHAIVEHDVILDEGAVVAPGAVLAGRCHLGRGASVGAHATVLPDREVGERAVVGAGAVLTHDVPTGGVVAGIPARPLERGTAA